MSSSTANVPFILKEEKEKRALCPVPEPKRPGQDWSWYSLFIPNLVAGLGVMCFAVLAYSFTELRAALSYGWATRLVIGGAICMALGGEFGTGFSILEVFRKHTKGESSRWDWVGLVISFVASTMSLFLSWAWLSGIMAGWTAATQVYGPLVLGFAGVADFYAGWMEAGMYKGTYEKRLAKWEENEYKPWRKWIGGKSGWSAEVDGTGEYVGTTPESPVAQAPVEPMPACSLPAPRSANPGVYDSLITGNDANGWAAYCPCGWSGTKLYTRKGYGVSAVAAHIKKAHNGTIPATVIDLPVAAVNVVVAADDTSGPDVVSERRWQNQVEAVGESAGDF